MSSYSPAWLPPGIARKAVVPTAGPRHLAPEAESTAETAATEVAAHVGRHAEPEWSRELFDPARDENPFDWLGFTDPTD